jgi:hypothetical protein
MITLCRTKEDLPQSRKSKKRKERMAKTAQVLSNLNENFFNFEPLVRRTFGSI